MDPKPLLGDIDSLRSQLWDGGRILIKISCALNEVAAPVSEERSDGTLSVPSCFVLMSRLSYLHRIDEVIIDSLRIACMETGQEYWFEYEGLPLRPSLPIGLLFDLTHKGRECRSGSKQDSPDSTSSPSSSQWNIIIHFTSPLISGGKFQYLSQIYCAGEKDTGTDVKLPVGQRLFLHSLKQACYLISGHTRAYSLLSEADRQDLLDILRRPNVKRFNSLLSDHFLGGLYRHNEAMKAVPVRVYLASSWQSMTSNNIGNPSSSSSSSSSSNSGGSGGGGGSTSSTVGSGGDDKDFALFTMLQKHVPLTADIDRLYLGSSSRSGGGGGEMALQYLSIGAVVKDCLASLSHSLSLPSTNGLLSSAISQDTYILYCQGVEVDKSTPATLLWRLMMYCDLFLYISVHPPPHQRHNP